MDHVLFSRYILTYILGLNTDEHSSCFIDDQELEQKIPVSKNQSA